MRNKDFYDVVAHKQQPQEYITVVARLAKPGEDIVHELTPDTAHVLHMAVGLVGEVGELCEAYGNFLEDCADDERRTHLVEELGDVIFYATALRVAFGGVDDHVEAPRFTAQACGMLLDVAKRSAIYGKPLDCTAGRMALGAVLAHVASMAFNVTVEEAREHNIRKLTKRYGEVYSNAAANARADKEAGQ